MTTAGAEAQGAAPTGLAIGDLAARTGVTPAVLRMWETRYGFPRPQRLESGHRRYAEADVAAVAEVLRRRDAGVRLETAIAEAAGDGPPATPSVYAELRRRHPHLSHQRLRKATLLALSWAIEDECLARAQRGTVFGAFQEESTTAAPSTAGRSWPAAPMRPWCSPGSRRPPPPVAGLPVEVPLTARAPMRREWAVVCDSPGFTAVLTAWELPGQRGVADADRLFESIWTVEPGPVRDAARICAGVAHDAGVPEAEDVRRALAGDPDRVPDPTAGAALLHRVLSYVDRSA